MSTILTASQACMPGSFARLNTCRLNSALYRFLLAITHLQAHYRAKLGGPGKRGRTTWPN